MLDLFNIRICGWKSVFEKPEQVTDVLNLVFKAVALNETLPLLAGRQLAKLDYSDVIQGSTSKAFKASEAYNVKSLAKACALCCVLKLKLECLICYKANVCLSRSASVLMCDISNANNPLFVVKGADLKFSTAYKAAVLTACHNVLFRFEHTAGSEALNRQASVFALLAGLERAIAALLR